MKKKAVAAASVLALSLSVPGLVSLVSDGPGGAGPLAVAGRASAQVPGAEPGVPALRTRGPLSARNASYRLRASLDDKTHRVTARGTLVWRNLERQPADRLVLHLYQNAFKNFATTFIRETGPQLRGDEMPEHGFGAIDVTALRVGGKDVLAQAQLDDTLLTLPLETPVGPSATVAVDFEWTVQLPKVFARSGWTDRFHAVTQWFPKIGVWECAEQAPAAAPAPDQATPAPACRWRAHQYHGNTEFFADYGTYDVEIDVPAGTEVGATGVLTADRLDGARRVLSYHAEDVHDFAWFADPDFQEVRDVVEDSLGPLRVRLLTRRGQQAHTGRHLASLRAAVKEADARLGAYPYGAITVVIPPADGNGAGGMEYPTIITSVAVPSPAGIRFLEETTAHEYGHQFFYGLLGSDEFEEAWLDEGLNTTFTQWAMASLTGPRCTVIDLPWLCMNDRDTAWFAYRHVTRRAPLSTHSYRLPRGTYAAMTYDQTAVTMNTLEGYLGAARMKDAVRRYAQRYRFQHPGRADFTAALSEGAGEDLGWFFAQALETTRVLDYEVTRITENEHELLAGLWDCPPRPVPDPPELSEDPAQAPRLLEAWRKTVRESQEAACAGRAPGRYELDPVAHKQAAAGSKDAAGASGSAPVAAPGALSRAGGGPAAPGTTTAPTGAPASATSSAPRPAGKAAPAKLYDSEIVVHRAGDFLMPVDIRVVFSDGVAVSERWTLAEQERDPSRVKTLRFMRRASRVVRAEVDPEGKLALDERRLNNGLLAAPDPRPVRRLWGSWLGAVQTLLDWSAL